MTSPNISLSNALNPGFKIASAFIAQTPNQIYLACFPIGIFSAGSFKI